MSTHPYVILNYVMGSTAEFTGRIVVEAYESIERNYAMVTFRAATLMDETTNRIMQSHGYSARRGPCPPPTTGLLCRSGTTLLSVWQWLSMHRGRLAYLVNEPLLTSVVAIVRTLPPPPRVASPYAAPRRHNSSRDSVDSSLPLYEPPPPSLHNSSVNNYSIREENEEDEGEVSSSNQSSEDVPASAAASSHSIRCPPPYWEIAQQTEYGRAHTRRVVAATTTAIFGAVPEGSLLSRSGSHRTNSIGQKRSASRLAGGGLARTFTQSMPSLPSHLQHEQAVAAAIEDSRRHAVATATASNNEHVLRYVQQSVAAASAVATSSTNNSDEQGTPTRRHVTAGISSRVRMARLSAKTNPEYGGKKHGGWLWRLLNM
ncbi:hypothetical protein GGI21_001230 [Coemansia aciculifera]|nr:hypothetical protein GGI21_001230 [Coemansia aciculifera]